MANNPEYTSELVHELDADGQQLRVVKLTDYSGTRGRKAKGIGYQGLRDISTQEHQ
jgi:hypothetical protein